MTTPPDETSSATPETSPPGSTPGLVTFVRYITDWPAGDRPGEGCNGAGGCYSSHAVMPSPAWAAGWYERLSASQRAAFDAAVAEIERFDILTVDAKILQATIADQLAEIDGRRDVHRAHINGIIGALVRATDHADRAEADAATARATITRSVASRLRGRPRGTGGRRGT